MYMHCLIAIILTLIWYSSGLVQVLIQVIICLPCLLVSLDQSNRVARDRGIQTDFQLDSTSVQQTSKTEDLVVRDEADSCTVEQKPSHRLQCRNVQKSLHNLFTCAYTQLVQPWYTVPEPRDNQPLHSALIREFDLITDRIIGKAMNVDLVDIIVGCVKILTQHVHNAKRSDGSPAYRCRTDEMAVLRDFAKALVRHLLPQHLWEQRLYCCALEEILATKVLVLVTQLSDPDNLNCLMVSQLDRASAECPETGVEADVPPPVTVESQDIDRLTHQPEKESPNDSKVKKKAKAKMKKILSVFSPAKIKSKRSKSKRKEKDEDQTQLLSLPHMPASLESDGAASSESSIYDSEELDIESDGSILQEGNDMEGGMSNCPEDTHIECDAGTPSEEKMEFKLSYEMWKTGDWVVRVTNVHKDEEESYVTIHLKEHKSENLHWSVKKTLSDIKDLCTHYKDCSSIETLLANIGTELTEEAGATLESHLQVLVSNHELSQTPLFKFFCPLSEEQSARGVWVFLHGLASFLTGQEDDELNDHEGEENPDKNLDSDGVWALPQRDVTQPGHMDTGVNNEEAHSSLDENYTSVSEKQATDCAGRRLSEVVNFAAKNKPVTLQKQAAALSGYESDGEDCISSYSSPGNENVKTSWAKCKEKPPQVKDETLNQPQEQDMASQPEFTEAVFDLLKEISDNSNILRFFKGVLRPFIPLIKKKLNRFLKTMTPSEAQIAGHIDNFCNSMCSERGQTSESPQRSEDVKEETKSRAMQLVVSKFAGYPVPNEAHLEKLFKIFQDPEENKKLIYMLLAYLLSEFLSGESFTVTSKLNVQNAVLI